MNLNIDERYSTYSKSIVFYLLHNDEKYSELWKSKYPQFENQLNNFFKDVNCGCRPPLLQHYNKHRFEVDVLTVNYINENKPEFNFDNFCSEYGGQDLRGAMFAIPATKSDYKDFLSSLQVKKANFSNFNSLKLGEEILITFF